MEECVLRRRVRNLGVSCDEGECVFWAHLGPEGEAARGQCAVQYFKLLDAPGAKLAEWLLSLKEDQLAQVLGLQRVPAE